MKYFDRPLRNLTLAVVVATAISTTAASIGAQNGSPVPRMWNDDEVAGLEVPLSHATFSPKHVSAEYYYQIPIRPIFRSYAVYGPGREPAGYFESLQQKDPEQIRIEASQGRSSRLGSLYLGLHDVDRAWKGFDWDAMNRLHEKGFISDPRGKVKSVAFTEEGLIEARRLLQELFSIDGSL
jgi:hypothetical protein